MPALTEGLWFGVPVTGTNPFCFKEVLSPHSDKFKLGFSVHSLNILMRMGTNTNPSPRFDHSLFGSVEKE